jgi:hypothetical protein
MKPNRWNKLPDPHSQIQKSTADAREKMFSNAWTESLQADATINCVMQNINYFRPFLRHNIGNRPRLAVNGTPFA